MSSRFIPRAWSSPDRHSFIEHIHYDRETGDRVTMDVVERDESKRVVLFDADDRPLVTEPWRKPMGFK